MASDPKMFPLPVVRDEPVVPQPERPFRSVLFHSLRISMVIIVLLLIRRQHIRFLAVESLRDQEPVAVESLREFFPNASGTGLFDAERRTQQILDAEQQTLGYVVQTSPQSDEIVGFSGPTNVLIAFGTDDRILGLKVLWSRDTREHVDLIERDSHFLRSWSGLAWADAAGRTSLDGVSGATLTSLAIAESIANRLGGSVPSLRFPDEIDVAEVVAWFPDASVLKQTPRRPPLLSVLNLHGQRLGYVFRTSPAADNLVGYQGPTDTLVALDCDETVLGIRLRHSFDNEPYVGYVQDEEYFLTLFNGRSLTELAELDLFEARVEGVSGATMTSMTVADALVLAAKEALVEVEAQETQVASCLPNPRQLATIAVVIAALMIGVTRLRQFRLLRLVLLLAVIAIPGLLNGDLVSQATLIGWTQNDVPWQFAIGLITVTVIAVLVPVFSKYQIYCHQLCPHGAVQQLVRKRLPWQWHVPRWLRKTQTLIPFVLLGWCITVAMLHLPFSLVDIEPFDAWIFQAAGTATIIIAVVGLGASLFVPMAYCRYGCPTGTLLNFLRFHSRSGHWSRSDWMATGLLAMTVGLSMTEPTGLFITRYAEDILNVIRGFISDHRIMVQGLTAFSGILFVTSLLAVPWLVARIPADYFVRSADDEARFRNQYPLLTMMLLVLRNVIGFLVILVGTAMLVLPGQGLLTILLGMMLISFPGKRRLEILIIRRRSINRVVSWMRQRAGREPLQLPDSSED